MFSDVGGVTITPSVSNRVGAEQELLRAVRQDQEHARCQRVLVAQGGALCPIKEHLTN